MKTLFIPSTWVLQCLFSLAWMASMAPLGVSAASAEAEKKRILVISSYHREYLWSQDTHRGVSAALLEHRYLENAQQVDAFTRDDQVESNRAVLLKLWMDTKRHSSRSHIAKQVSRIVEKVKAFRPDIILLGDDNATNYIGNQYLDTDTPLVFWGVNGYPVKYGLLDSVEQPGHNVTGVYQAGYLQEGLLFLTRLLPTIQSFAVLSDDSPTGRSKAKELAHLARQGKLPIRLVETVITGSELHWKARALALQDQVDAFFVLNHNTLLDPLGNAVDPLQLGAWYLRHIKTPGVAHERQFVTEGILCAVDDSGFKQGYEAVQIAHRILEKGEAPANIAAYAPSRGRFLVNRARARMLGLEAQLMDNPLIEEIVEDALALLRYPAPAQ